MKDGTSTETHRRTRRCTRAGGSVGFKINVLRARRVNLVVRRDGPRENGSAVTPPTFDLELFERRVTDFLRSPAGERVWGEFEIPRWFGLALCGLYCAIGLVKLPTVIWTISGIRSIYEGLTFKPLRDCRCKARDDFTLLRPVIGFGIVANPKLNVGLVLGSLDPKQELAPIGELARRFTNIYSTSGPEEDRSEIAQILRDDAYRPYRRRVIPRAYAPYADRELTLFDVELDAADGEKYLPEIVMYAFVATTEKDGMIKQIPWAIAAPCFQ
jgi:hypothetical protein